MTSIVDAQLDAIALVRSRLNGDDEAFDAILDDKGEDEIRGLLSYSCALTGMLLNELLPKMQMLASIIDGESVAPTPEEFLNNLIKEVFNQS
jgi:hypothetical protein